MTPLSLDLISTCSLHVLRIERPQIHLVYPHIATGSLSFVHLLIQHVANHTSLKYFYNTNINLFYALFTAGHLQEFTPIRILTFFKLVTFNQQIQSDFR